MTIKLTLLVFLALCLTLVRSGNDEDSADIADMVLAESIKAERDPEHRSSYRWRSGGDTKGADIIEDSDMDLTATQYAALYTPSSGRDKRQNQHNKWAKPWTDGVVPYEFNGDDFSEEHKGDVRTAMETIERWSCVVFREKNGNDKNYILFQSGTRGRCSSAVGMQGRGQQQINLAPKGCRLISTYIHEMLHALGFVHEHQLPTRTGFLKQYLVNSKAEKQHNFNPYSADAMADYRQEYDLGSIMHYSARSFAMNDGKTMSTGQGFQDEYIGMKYFNQLSFGDVKSVNMFYKCADRCPKDDACEARGGITLKDCTCLTPDDYDDKTCQDTKPASYCEDKLLSGECFMSRKDRGTECPKTCGYCSVFKTGQPARQEDKRCDDYYHNQAKCAEWKAAGHCEVNRRRPSYSKWMGMFCRKTCGQCGQQDICPNFILYEYICFWYQQSLCTDMEARWGKDMRKSCPTRCGLCGQRKEGNCRNRRSDAECKARADAGGCEEDSIQMFQDCPKTCDRCSFNTGRCENFHSDEQDCLELAATNHCVSGSNKIFMEKRCAKACNTCHAATVPCEDIDQSGNCAYFARYGHCDNPLRNKFMRRRCAKSCGYC